MSDVKSVECYGVQIDAIFVGVRLGYCEDRQGNSYLDLGAGVGPGLGVYVLHTHERRSNVDFHARGGLGLGLALEGSSTADEYIHEGPFYDSVTDTVGVGGGGGLGVTVGARGLVPLKKHGVNTPPSR